MPKVDPNIPHMRRALKLARQGLGRVEPNPMVGCVLVQRGRVIGEGFHGKFGLPHAEIKALEDCAKRRIETRGCDVFVTLEPCSHHGKTPPCADALIKANVKRVFIAMGDPFPEVNGEGIVRLEAAGIDVKLGLCAKEARELNHAYIKRVTTGLPWMIAKWAQTIDGRIATRTGDSQWISNEKSRQQVHQLRSRVDAVMVGIGTAMKDDPSLTARDVKVKRIARRIVVDPMLRLPLESKLVTSLKEGGPPLTVITKEGSDNNAERLALEAAGVEVVACLELKGDGGTGVPPVVGRDGQSTGRSLDLTAAMQSLTDKHKLTNVLVEGGSRLISSLFGQQLIDEAHVYLAPKWLGDNKATPAIGGFERKLMKDAETLALQQVTRVEDDVWLTYRVRSQIK